MVTKMIGVRAALLAALLRASTAALAAGPYYVDPVSGNDKNNGLSTGKAFRTVNRARAVVATQNKAMTSDINVYLRRGVHTLTSTLTFTPTDSGTNGFYINYIAMPGETPEISGGKGVTGWSQVPGTNLWQANVSPSAGYASYFRQLYVNGRRARIAEQGACIKSTGLWNDPTTANSADGVKFAGTSVMANYTNPSNLVIFHYKIWKEDRLPVTEVIRQGSDVIFRTAQPGTQLRANRGMFDPGDCWKIQNAFEELDAPGEWYLDQSAHKVYYYPRAGEDMATAKAVVPVVEMLVNFQGGSTKVRNIRLQGLTTEYDNWLFPKDNLLGGTQAEGLYDPSTFSTGYDLEVPGQISLNQTDGIQLIRNVMRYSAVSGVHVYNGADNTLIQGNVVYNTTAAGISIGRLDKLWSGTTDQDIPYEEQSDTTLVSNNVVSDTGSDYWQATGISLMNPLNAKILHNVVFHTGYMGIHQRAGEIGEPQPGFVGNSEIGYNHVYNANWAPVSDNGAMYSFGMNTPSDLHDNFLQDTEAAHGYYNDNQSDENTLRNNVMIGQLFMRTGHKKTTPYTNYARDNYSMNNNPVYTYAISSGNKTGLSSWPAAARTIIDSSGLEPAFRDISDKVALLPGDNLLMASTQIGASTGWSNLDRLSDGTIATGSATNASGGDSYLDFDAGRDFANLVFTLKPENVGVAGVSDWKLQRYSVSQSAWVDIFGWQPVPGPTEQVYVPTATISSRKFRLYVRNARGSNVALQEFTMRSVN